MALLSGPGEIDNIDYRSRQEFWLKQMAVGANAPGVGLSEGPTSALRTTINAAAIEVSVIPQYHAVANSARTRCRVTNNATALPTAPCDVIISYSTLSASAWDQVIRPGESALLDAPALAFSVATISAAPGSIGGQVIVTSYLT